MLNFVLAESALELVPEEIRRTPSVAIDAKRREKDASEILLDRSFHQSAMGRLKDSEKRGRPDMVHVTLLSVTATPIYLDGRVKVYVHTNMDIVVELEPMTRIPKSYFRFRGLMEKALVEMPKDGLVRVYPSGMVELLKKRIGRRDVTALSVQGKRIDLEVLGKEVASAEGPCVIVGGFPRGHFCPATMSVTDRLVRIDERPLEAHVVAARLMYEVEKASEGMND